MLTAEKMDRISAAVLRADADSVLETLAELNVLHPARIEEIDTWADTLSQTDAQQARAEYEMRRERAHQLIESAGAQMSGPAPHATSVRGISSLSELDSRLAAIDERITPALNALADARARRDNLTGRAAQVDLLLPAGLPFAGLAQSTFLYTAAGALATDRLPAFHAAISSMPVVLVPLHETGDATEVLCVGLRSGKAELDQALRDCGFRAAALPVEFADLTEEARRSLGQELHESQEAIARCERDLDLIRAELAPALLALKRALDDAITVLALKSFCRESEAVCVFAGWAPSAKSPQLVRTLREKAGGRAIVIAEQADRLEPVRAESLDVPVLARLPSCLRPFQLLTDGYGVPAYRAVNPTLFVAVTFLLMFGMMFGDVGHGSVLVIAGAILARRGTATRNVARLLLYCGGVSIAFGALYGSVFGFETLIPTLWVKPLEHTSALFTAALVFGCVVISAGLILNIVNMIRCRALLHDFFDVSGPLTLVAYWSALGIAAHFLFAGGHGVPSGIVLALVLVPLLAFYAKGPVLAFAGIQEKAFPEGIVGYLMECTVKILEVLMGCLANTVSFIRVAAFGLAHAGLFVAVFSIAEALPEGAVGTLASWLVLVLGNAVVIVLEGLVVTIQAMRLEYYEFFGKFFTRMGTRYQPVGFTIATG